MSKYIITQIENTKMNTKICPNCSSELVGNRGLRVSNYIYCSYRCYDMMYSLKDGAY